MGLQVKELANLTGISVRTLHHYDHIGLLVPSTTTDAGYRLYADADIAKLQQILFFRALDFPLKEIKRILASPDYSTLEALDVQRSMLMERRAQLNEMIETIDKTIRSKKGEFAMSNEERFKGMAFKDDTYEQEARERWGDAPIEESKRRVESLSDAEQQALGEEWERIYRKLAEVMQTESPESARSQEAIAEWFHYLNANFGTYSKAAFAGLGEMYVADERFTKNIDAYGDGLAVFMAKAMKEFGRLR
ncbi:MerR family transcriptional regulator [Paenalkalicoccus suaedae]|uniref:MerR family transcriptional regulator n=1 Tax=Paenalkalicoccus suaedae TaxID=2592382 RepID=A0A859FJL3_9BACI|nr:MerR family transcriptional regulator [Paenalkalicoccus suaedae]QKS73000.1 MerR family transcriptional regulator [Paenalkalicoccus suaedae]